MRRSRGHEVVQVISSDFLKHIDHTKTNINYNEDKRYSLFRKRFKVRNVYTELRYNDQRKSPFTQPMCRSRTKLYIVTVLFFYLELLLHRVIHTPPYSIMKYEFDPEIIFADRNV